MGHVLVRPDGASPEVGRFQANQVETAIGYGVTWC
jgi:hypothetical protein